MAAENDILAKVEEYLMDDPSFSDDFEKFASENCSVFEDSEENKLEYTVIYQQFTDLFNARIEAFITSQGSTLEQFVAQCEKADDDNFAVMMILSITSFDAFKELMVAEKQKAKTNVPEA